MLKLGVHHDHVAGLELEWEGVASPAEWDPGHTIRQPSEASDDERGTPTMAR